MKKMNDLFNRKDILTIATADKAVIGTKGFFGDNLEEIIDAVKRNKIRTLSDVDMLATYNFWSNEEMNYMFFLPADKVKNKEAIYRPLRSIDELFDFMLPDYAGADYTTDEKVEKLLGQRYTIKDKIDGTLKQHIVSFLDIPSDETLLLDFVDLKFLFENYEFKRGDKFVPFGIKEE